MAPRFSGAMTPGRTTVATSVSICLNGSAETDQFARAVTSGLPIPSHQSTVQCTSVCTGTQLGLPNTGFIGFVLDRVGSVGVSLLHELIDITEIKAHTIARFMIDSKLTLHPGDLPTPRRLGGSSHGDTETRRNTDFAFLVGSVDLLRG